MKFSASIVIFLLSLIVSVSCAKEDAALPDSNGSPSTSPNSELMKGTLIVITVGDKQFRATLESNNAANELKKMLPLTISMSDLNSNEKFFDLPYNLPIKTSDPETINTGDIMLWGSNTLVLFYKTFSTSYNYTRLGKIENASGLSQALGSGSVTVTFELLVN